MVLSLQTSAQKRPNIVIIYADDMGYGDLEYSNPKSKIQTPNLNQLAKEGTIFTNAHSSSGICTPSRYALLTGKYHWRSFHNIVDSWDSSVFKSTDITIADVLKGNGYQTACIGKWHLGWDWNSIKKSSAERIIINKKETYNSDAFDWSKSISDGPTDHGFNYYFGDDVPNFPPYCWFKNNRVVTPPTKMLEINVDALEGKWEARPGPSLENWDFYNVMPTITQNATEWIKQQSNAKPFFLYFALTAPHAPIVPSKEWQGKSAAGAYGDYMMQADWSVGQVMTALKDYGFADNTIVIFSSDNGPEYYAYDRVRNFKHSSMGEFRGVKRDIWEGGHRIPLIIKWPNQIPAGRTTNGLISQIDIFKTLAKIVHSKIPKDAAQDSKNQLNFILGANQSNRKSVVYNTLTKYGIQKDGWVYINASNGQTTKMPEWFLNDYGYTIESTGKLLFKLDADFSQHHNVINQFPKIANKLKIELEKLTLNAVD